MSLVVQCTHSTVATSKWFYTFSAWKCLGLKHLPQISKAVLHLIAIVALCTPLLPFSFIAFTTSIHLIRKMNVLIYLERSGLVSSQSLVHLYCGYKHDLVVPL